MSEKFPGLSIEDLKAGIFNESQFRLLIREVSVIEIEQLAPNSFVVVTKISSRLYD